MSTLERYKKKGGFVQILTLIESSEPAKADKFLSIIAQESPIWADAIKQKSLDLTKISSFTEKMISEAFESIPATVLATGLLKEPEAVRNKITSCLSPTLQKKIELAQADNPDPRPGDIIACRLRMIGSCRAAMTDNRIKPSQLPADLRIPEDIETQLSQASWSHALNTIDGEGLGNLKPASSNNELPADVTELRNRLSQSEDQVRALKSQVAELQNRIDQIKKIVL